MSGGQLRRTRRAEKDLLELWLHIAQDNEAAADALLDRIEEKCALLASSPEMGPARRDIAPGLRFFPVERYVILYRIIDNGVEIVRVVHGARYLPALLS